MKQTRLQLKLGLIGLLTALAVYLHYHTAPGDVARHLVHRELFFLPVILAAFWFGFKGGLLSSLAVSFLYAPHVVAYRDPHGELYAVISQLLTFLSIGIVLGWLVQRRNAALMENSFLDETFGRYVPQKIRTHVLAGNSLLDGSICKTTVLAVKIQNLHTAIEKLPPWQVVTMINTYFSKMAAVVKFHDGLMIGHTEDEFKVVFGAPVAQPGHRRQGLEMALEMRNRLAQINAVFAEQGLPGLQHSVGIHSGLALGASLGSPARKTYNVVGPTVRIAQLIRKRCMQENKDILASDEVLRDIRPLFETGRLATRLRHSGGAVGLNTFGRQEAKAC